MLKVEASTEVRPFFITLKAAKEGYLQPLDQLHLQ